MNALDAMQPGKGSRFVPVANRDRIAVEMHGHRGTDKLGHYELQPNI